MCIELIGIALVFFAVGIFFGTGTFAGIFVCLGVFALFLAVVALFETNSFTAPYVPPPRDPPTR
ncbi:MAG TPA: hypothetical protein VFN13_08025 [Rudaea sp.]|nr:hypothetical protein [Rudaea sp.]